MATKRQNIEDAKIKYLVIDNKGEFIIELPADWKVTFGWVNPGSKAGSGYGSDGGHCMRVWEGEKLRAVYANVKSFRDMSLPLARKVQRETGSASWTMDSEGNFEHTKKVEVESELLLEEAEDDVGF